MSSIELDLTKMKVADLKKELKDRNLATTGNKGELVQRLSDSLHNVDSITEDELLKDIDISLDPSPAKMARLTEEGDATSADASIELSTSVPPVPSPPAASSAIPNGTAAVAAVPATAASVASVPPPTVAAAAEDPRSLTDDEKRAARARRFSSSDSGAAAGDANLTDEAKKKARMERFGDVAAATETVTDKSKAKSTTVSSGIINDFSFQSVSGDDEEKKKARALKFGLTSGASATTTATASYKSSEDIEKLKNRALRFGTADNVQVGKLDNDEKARRRRERFGAVDPNASLPKKITYAGEGAEDLDEKKKKRGERFGLITSP